MAGSLTERLLDRAHSGVVSLDEAGLVTYWNPSAERMFGIERAQALGRPVAELIIPDRYRETHRAGIRRFLAEGVGPMLDRRVEMAALRADGCCWFPRSSPTRCSIPTSPRPPRSGSALA